METLSEKELNELVEHYEKKMDWKTVFALLELKSYRAKEKYMSGNGGVKHMNCHLKDYKTPC